MINYLSLQCSKNICIAHSGRLLSRSWGAGWRGGCTLRMVREVTYIFCRCFKGIQVLLAAVCFLIVGHVLLHQLMYYGQIVISIMFCCYYYYYYGTHTESMCCYYEV